MTRRTDREHGAVAILMALMMALLFVVAAFALDLTRLYAAKQRVQRSLDAASVAGAAMLPNTSQADALARSIALANDPATQGLDISFACVVGSTGDAKTVDTSDIPSDCNPGPAPYDWAHYPGMACNTVICAIPCSVGHTCNAIRLMAFDTVPFYFAPIIGIDSGFTGALVSAACSGACGTTVVNPLDVVVVADRTASMGTNITPLASSILSMFQTMTPSVQFAALGTIGTSAPIAGCPSKPSTGPANGNWMPVAFSADYLNGAALNTSSPIVQALSSPCWTSSPYTSNPIVGTFLAWPMRTAAYYLLHPELLNASYTALQTARDLTPRKAIIFETDGEPTESGTVVLGANPTLDLTPVSNATAATACQNLKYVAEAAKAKGILIVTVAFGTATKANTKCGAERVSDVLAAVASKDAAGQPSTSAAGDCVAATENADGDNFFCAATGTELASLFKTALGQLTAKTRLITLPTG